MVGVYLAAIIIYMISSSSCAKAKDCPEICGCLGSYVDCSGKKLDSVPPNLPKWSSHLELNRNQLKYIEALTFQSLENLTILKLKRNQITQLKDGAFYGLLSIDKLILDYNHVHVISKGWLYGLKSLRELSLSHNNMSSIEPDAWEFCMELHILDLSFNRLESIAPDSFKNLEDLQKLVLNNNNIAVIGDKAFSHLPNLKILHLSNNKISWTVEDSNGVFQSLGNLIKFHLSGNFIKSINRNAFLGLKNVTFLNLSNNNVTSIQKNAFSEVPLLMNLIINTTCLLCDCNLHWFYEWLTMKQFKIHTICAYPEWLRGQPLLEVPSSNFTCDELPKPRLIEEPEPAIMALKGENISLKCTAMSSSNSVMTFQWKKDNVELFNPHVVARSSSADGKTTETVSELNILKVQHSNAGKYQCVVSNNFGTTYSQKATISVLIFPTFLKTPANITSPAGSIAKLECAVYGEPQPEIGWQKDGGNDFPAARERRMHVMPADDAFFITNVKPSDMGIYSCTAQNTAGTIVANASLTVQEKPSFVKTMENKEVTAGELVVIQCMASGTPKPSIRWLKDGGPIRATERHFFTAEDQLMIVVDTIQSDSGQYECHLTNPLGDVTGYSQLIVKPVKLTFGNILQYLSTTDMMGIIIITVVCCAVATSIIWVVIIYQTRKRLSPLAGTAVPECSIEFHDKSQFADNTSDRSSCKDSGTGDSAKRSTDDLAPEEFSLVVAEAPAWGGAGAHAPLLHSDASFAHSNHDRAGVCEVSAPEAPQ